MSRFYINVISFHQFSQILCMFDIACDEKTSSILLKAMQQNAYAIASKGNHDYLENYLWHKTHVSKKAIRMLIDYFSSY